MLCDAVSEDEILEAYLLYASLHGYNTDTAHVQARIASYLNNVPDSIIDEALLAFAEDRIIAPPDVVLPHWGRSRIYELVQTPQQEWRHHVCENWFENDCQFYNDSRDPSLYHFWTHLTVVSDCNAFSTEVSVGTRLQLQWNGDHTYAHHRQLGVVGELPKNLANEIFNRRVHDLRYLVLVDGPEAVSPESPPAVGGAASCKLLVTAAGQYVGLGPVIAYARQAFQAKRGKC